MADPIFVTVGEGTLFKHTYIIGDYNTSVSHTTSVACVNYIHGRRGLKFKATPKENF